jgi:hypothetical protein
VHRRYANGVMLAALLLGLGGLSDFRVQKLYLLDLWVGRGVDGLMELLVLGSILPDAINNSVPDQ